MQNKIAHFKSVSRYILGYQIGTNLVAGLCLLRSKLHIGSSKDKKSKKHFNWEHVLNFKGTDFECCDTLFMIIKLRNQKLESFLALFKLILVSNKTI